MSHCPCGSAINYSLCCELYIMGKQNPSHPEALMRSRYTAYTQSNIEYIKKTMSGKALIGFDEGKAKKWASKVCWIRLQVIDSMLDSINTGSVEFEAFFVENALLKSIHEKSTFLSQQGRWLYVDGIQLPGSQAETIVSRHMNCPCGSQRKYKNCHEKMKLS